MTIIIRLGRRENSYRLPTNTTENSPSPSKGGSVNYPLDVSQARLLAGRLNRRCLSKNGQMSYGGSKDRAEPIR